MATTLDSLQQDIDYIKSSLDDMKKIWNDHEKRLQNLERNNAIEQGYQKGREDSEKAEYRKQRIWIAILAVAVAILSVVVYLTR